MSLDNPSILLIGSIYGAFLLFGAFIHFPKLP